MEAAALPSTGAIVVAARQLVGAAGEPTDVH
jgi:hypothetical protein